MREFRILTPDDPVGSYQVGETPQDAAYRFFLTWGHRLELINPLVLMVEWPPYTGQMTAVTFVLCPTCQGEGVVGPEAEECPDCGGSLALATPGAADAFCPELVPSSETPYRAPRRTEGSLDQKASEVPRDRGATQKGAPWSTPF